jgi:hypothetical protein
VVGRADAIPYQREAEVVLAMWRDVERQLGEAAPDSDTAARLLDESARLRAEYHRLIDLAREHHRPEPPPFPTERGGN